MLDERIPEELKIVGDILTQRYATCDAEGHKKANPEGNECDHCYRQIEYQTPQTNAIFESRSALPVDRQPLDAPVMMQRAREEIELQKALDYICGLRKLQGEFKQAGLLERLTENP